MSDLFVLRQQELLLREIKDQMRSCEEKETDNSALETWSEIKQLPSQRISIQDKTQNKTRQNKTQKPTHTKKKPNHQKTPLFLSQEGKRYTTLECI